MGVNIEYLSDLANIEALPIAAANNGQASFDFYQRHATAILDIVQSRFDDETWQRVSKPIHDLLAIQKRDALTARAMEDLGEFIEGRKSPDILYEYLLIDVQMGSEIDTSRIVQGLAALQLYVTRCLMNLEKDVDPEQIPADEWQWMKNYRVWEANRKVFLYPENFIEPELRDTKTPEFKALEEELLQNDINKDTAAVAYTHFLDKFAGIANLTIMGSYFHTETIPEDTHALKFATGGHVDIGTIAEVASLLPQSFTAEMWIKHDNGSSTGGILSAYNWPISNLKQKGWFIWVRNGRFQLYISTDDDEKDDITGGDGKLTTLSTDAFQKNKWYNLAVTYNGSKVCIYVDGILGASTTTRSGPILYPSDTTIPFVLGALRDEDTGYLDYPFKGEIRELRLWNTARSQGEIFQTMFNGVTEEIIATGLKRYWKMDEGAEVGSPAVGTFNVVDYAEGQGLDFSSNHISWVRTKQTAVQTAGDSDIETTLYLFGRNDATREHYFREYVNGKTWLPWKKIDLSINSDFVSPIFAFNKLFIFWAEISEKVKSENRKHVRTEGINFYDQLGNRIEIEDGKTIEKTTKNVLDKHEVIEQVNRPKWNPVIKYSFYNFSQVWTQPQNFPAKGLKSQLSETERIQPKWERVYAQRWRESFTEDPVQRPPEALADVEVTQLGTNSFAKKKRFRL